MKDKNKKIVIIILLTISVANIISLICGYISSLNESHSFNESLSHSIHNITIFTIILLFFQITNIILIFILVKKELNNKNQKKIFFWIFTILIVTLLIPVKVIHSIYYTYPSSNSSNPLDLSTTTHTTTYKNLYGITLKNSEYTSMGIELY